MNQLIAQRLKAVGAALISGVGAYLIAYLVQGQQFTLHGLESAVALAVVTGAGVHRLPNASPLLSSTLRIRQAGKRGRKPITNKVPIDFLDTYLRAPLPAPVYPIDVTHSVTAWGMLGNGPDPTCTTRPDGVGDCGFAARQHLRMAKAAGADLTETWETSNELVAEYLTYDGGKDQGINPPDALMAWYKDGDIEAFAPIDHTSATAIDSAMVAFNGVWVAVDLTDDADQLFEQAQPWTVANGQKPDPDDGHMIVKLRADGKSLDGYCTWGAMQPATMAWSKKCVIGAWVLLTKEDDALVDLTALKADIAAYGGQGGGTVSPPSFPPVVANTVVTIDDVALVNHIEELAAKAKLAPADYLTARLEKLWSVK